MRIKRSVSRIFGVLVVPAITLAVVAYFGAYAIWGNRGVLSLEDTQAQLGIQQQQLAQLNYYNGSIDGLMGPQTIAAITYLQRDAGLPQTGTMTPATQAALANFLANGNNQMGGNVNVAS